MNISTAASRATAALVAAVAGWASYRHIFDVATNAGEHQGVAAVLPLSVDGLILVATLRLLDDKRAGHRPTPAARAALVFGIGATLAANIASAEPTLTARAVAAIPAVAFLLSVEVLTAPGRPHPDKAPAAAPAAVDEHQGDELPAPVPVRRRWRRGELAQEVARLVDQHAAELPTTPTARAARLAELTGGSVRHIERLLTTEGATA